MSKLYNTLQHFTTLYDLYTQLYTHYTQLYTTIQQLDATVQHSTNFDNTSHNYAYILQNSTNSTTQYKVEQTILYNIVQKLHTYTQTHFLTSHKFYKQRTTLYTHKEYTTFQHNIQDCTSCRNHLTLFYNIIWTLLYTTLQQLYET